MRYRLKIISSSVRKGRKGPIIAAWITELARQHGSFEVEMIDLGEIKLPMMDEPNHPMLRKYEYDHSKQWSATVDQADAFIFVTAEYDHNYPAPLRNALEYLVLEWGYKPAGIVSYGGISSGTRAAKSLMGDLASLKVVAIAEAVNLPSFTQFVVEGKFIPNEIAQKAAASMLKELVRYSKGMKSIREDLG